MVVLELKPAEDGGHIELQTFRYAAMVSAMTFQRVVNVCLRSRKSISQDMEAARNLFEFFEWEKPHEYAFAQEVRVVLVAAALLRELRAAVLWLHKRGA